ncbi:MAG: formate dehydrogenase accessory sulfurtransferase FdhD [Burkholderiales bacterium]
MNPIDACIHPDGGAALVAAQTLTDGNFAPTEQWVAEERPVALVYNGVSHAVMLASPLDLEDLALGFSLTEGIIESPAELLDFEQHDSDVGITLDLRVTLRCFMRLKERRRTLAGRTGCGLCGTESLDEAIRPVRRTVSPPPVGPAAVRRAMNDLGSSQVLQPSTGGTHAAAWCGLDGAVRLVREDVGRHNALDKLIGAMVRADLDPTAGFIVATSRASYEMVFKTATAGVGLLATISAPTALAVRTAQTAGLCLIGFARGTRGVVYSHGDVLSGAAAPVQSNGIG